MQSGSNCSSAGRIWRGGPVGSGNESGTNSPSSSSSQASAQEMRGGVDQEMEAWLGLIWSVGSGAGVVAAGLVAGGARAVTAGGGDTSAPYLSLAL